MLPDWLRKKRCLYAVDKFDDNLCVWRCLAIYTRRDMERGTEYLTAAALKLARSYYENGKLKRIDVKPTKLVDFEKIAEWFKINIRVFEPKVNSEDTTWGLIYGQSQYKEGYDTLNLGMFQGHCFYIKRLEILCKRWECLECKQIFTRSNDLARHVLICRGGETLLFATVRNLRDF